MIVEEKKDFLKKISLVSIYCIFSFFVVLEDNFPIGIPHKDIAVFSFVKSVRATHFSTPRTSLKGLDP